MSDVPRRVRVLCPRGHYITDVDVHGSTVNDNPNRFRADMLAIRVAMVCRHKGCGYKGSLSLHGFARDMERVHVREYRMTS